MLQNKIPHEHAGEPCLHSGKGAGGICAAAGGTVQVQPVRKTENGALGLLYPVCGKRQGAPLNLPRRGEPGLRFGPLKNGNPLGGPPGTSAGQSRGLEGYPRWPFEAAGAQIPFGAGGRVNR